jgi:hypothetical protein
MLPIQAVRLISSRAGRRYLMEETFIDAFLKIFSAFATGWFVFSGFFELTFSTH